MSINEEQKMFNQIQIDKYFNMLEIAKGQFAALKEMEAMKAELLHVKYTKLVEAGFLAIEALDPTPIVDKAICCIVFCPVPLRILLNLSLKPGP